MLTYLRKLLKNDKGFTLIELLIVVIILGILAAIAIPKFTNTSASAKITAAKADLKTFSNQLELYKFENGKYPLTADGLAKLAENEKYLKSVPKDPWTTVYSYASDDGSTYTLYSFGPDATDDNGTDDDIKL